MRSMDRLTENERKVLWMRVMEDMTYDEITERTGMNNLTLRVLLSRARSKIRYVK